MGGFAIVFETDPAKRMDEATAGAFVDTVATHKGLPDRTPLPDDPACRGAKLDSGFSLHPGLVQERESGSWLLAAGTIFDRKASDGVSRLEALLRSLLAEGERALADQDGPFALVLYEKRERCLKLIADPLGFFSVFYGQVGSRFFLATSALAVAERVRSAPSRLALECFLRSGKVYGETTLWRDVRRLKPGVVLTIREGSVSSSVHWAPSLEDSAGRLSLDDSVEYAEEVLTRSIRQAYRQEPKVWVDLTGGFDSRFAAALLDRAGIPFIANCVGPSGYPDVEIAGEMSRALGWDFRQITMPENWKREQRGWIEKALYRGDAHLDVVHLATVLYGHQWKGDDPKVLAQGLGGDLWRGGFWRHVMAGIGKTSRLNYDRMLDFWILKPTPSPILKGDRLPELWDRIRSEFREVASRYGGALNTVQLDAIYEYQNTSHAGAFQSAAAGMLRCLSPFCLKDTVNAGFSLPPGWRDPRRSRLVRSLLERLSPRAAAFPTTSGGPALPMRLTNIHRFSPFWIGAVRKVVKKFSTRWWGRPISLGKPPDHPSYPLPEWRRGLLEYTAEERLLAPERMRSAALYVPGELTKFLAEAASDHFTHDQFLGRIITVEMALRAVGADLTDRD